MRAPHHREAVSYGGSRPGWLEAHTENYMDSAADLEALLAARRFYPISLHGVALSLGGDAPLNPRHLKATKHLVDEVRPGLVSEHLTWVAADGIYLNDLIPLPRNSQALRHICGRIRQMQDYLGRQILVENPVRYIEYLASDIPEPEFLNHMAEKAECGLLLDINNVYINSKNNNFSAEEYIRQIEPKKVREMHLAGFWRDPAGLIIDSHDCPVQPEVWRLYQHALGHIGKTPTLVEWDGNIPAFAELVAQAALAEAELRNH